MKKKIFLIAVALICVSILGYGSFAYFTTTDTARNVITSDGLDIEIEEWQQTDNGLVAYPKDKPIRVMPTSKVSKIVTVKNLDAESYVRVKLDVTVLDSDDEEMTVTEEQLKKVIHLQMNGEDWTEKDGWWYYNSSMDAGDVSKPVMTGVEFDGPNMTNEYQNCTVKIDVTAQAVQVAHNGTDALAALGWPAE